MPVIEILCYTPKDMEEFIAYCLHGKPDGQGDYLTDAQGRKITGVIRWLLGRGVRKAEFFNSSPIKEKDPVNLFASTVQRRESFDVPWMRTIPGFEEMVKTEGFIGRIEEFAPLSDLLASVRSNPELNGRFNQDREGLDQILAATGGGSETPSPEGIRLLAALRGEQGSNPAVVFQEVHKKFEFFRID